MSRLLGIQFRRNETSLANEQESIRREVEPYAEIDFVSALDMAIDWQYPETVLQGYDGVVLGGSGDFDFDGGRAENDEAKRMSYEILGRLRPLFSYLFEHDIPTLGICFGHQLLGAFAGAQVVNDHSQKKSRSHTVRLLAEHQDHFLFSGLPTTFPAHYGHKDSLDRIPGGAVLLVEGGEQCRVSALQYKNNIFTTQFHPELNFDDIVARMGSAPGYLPEGVTAEDLFVKDDSATQLLGNFARFVNERTSH